MFQSDIARLMTAPVIITSITNQDGLAIVRFDYAGNECSTRWSSGSGFYGLVTPFKLERINEQRVNEHILDVIRIITEQRGGELYLC